jgi:hypothetical protein
MIRPARFAANPETATSNRFQTAAPTDPEVAALAAHEFDVLAVALAAAGVRVHAFAGARDADLPDEVFPNNWVSFHADGTAVLYPLLAPNRRRERRPELVDALRAQGYRVARVVDLTHFEPRNQYLEGTGSLVLDRVNRVAYACRSPRTHDAPLTELGRALGYETRAFGAADRDGHAIYHTNVLLSIGTSFAVVASSALRDDGERRDVVAGLAEHREVIELSLEQLHSFAGNLLELRAGDAPVIALSAAALASLRAPQRRALEAHGELVVANIGTIEKHGGGSVRCMLAEVALPRA